MKVRALKMVSPGSGLYNPGEIFEVDEAQARCLIDAGVVEAASPPSKGEGRKEGEGQGEGQEEEDRSVAEAPEDRMMRGKRRK